MASHRPWRPDLADRTLRCRLDTEHYARPLESLVSNDVVERDLGSSKVLQFIRPSFHIAQDNFALNYQAGSLFHLVLPPNCLPVSMEFDPNPTYGWRKNDRFVLGWQRPLGEKCNFVFAKVAKHEFLERAKEAGNQIKISAHEEPIDRIGVQVEENGIIEKIHDALLDTYKKQDDLKMLVTFANLGKSLAEIARNSNLDQVTHDLVIWAEKNGKMDVLLRTAYRRNGSNFKLRAVVEEYFGELPERA